MGVEAVDARTPSTLSAKKEAKSSSVWPPVSSWDTSPTTVSSNVRHKRHCVTFTRCNFVAPVIAVLRLVQHAHRLHLVLPGYDSNKCIGDDTKAAARQSLNCIKNQKINYGEKRSSIWRMEFLHPAMWHGHDIDFVRWLHPAMWYVALESWQWIHQVAAPYNVIRGSGMTRHWIRPVAAPLMTRSSGIMTLNSPGGSTLQCDRWLWDDMPLNTPKRPPYCNSTSGFDFYHITAVDMLFCTGLRHFIQIGPPSTERNDVTSIFKMANLSHLGFSGSNNGFFEMPMCDFL